LVVVLLEFVGAARLAEWHELHRSAQEMDAENLKSKN
jgi:hypothetical protein